jgi:predicted AlkP superfamily pyrophosphatase or phosphodiesterase
MTTGVSPEQHGVVANGFYYRDKGEVEMWTAWNECILAPQIWERLAAHDSSITSAVWFPLHSKGAKAKYICTPAPIHNPDGSESLWCYTVPTEMYGELRDQIGHFPLMHFWGPMANIKSTDWIVDSAVIAAKAHRPNFSYIYLPHLDYASQKFGPNSPQAIAALSELDAAIGRLVDGYNAAGLEDTTWLAATEYVVNEVSQVGYPNRVLREAGLLSLDVDAEGREQLNVSTSRAWAMVDHQFAHVYVKDAADIERVADVLQADPTVERALEGGERESVGLNHPRSGEVVLLAKPDAWFAYYWWLDDAKAPLYARTVDIHRKPGYDPVELYIDMPTRSIPLDATLVKGSHGYPADDPSRHGVLIASDAEILPQGQLRDIDVCGIVLKAFGCAEH